MYNQDPKYKKLRQKLDNIGYKQHLDPTSVELVDKLLTGFSKMSEKLQKMNKQKSKPQLQPNVAQLKNELELISDLYESVRKENESLKANIQQNGIEEKIKTLQSSLNNCRVGYEQKIDQANTKLTNYQKNLQALGFQNKTLKEENTKIKKMFALQQDETETSTSQLTGILEKKKKHIQGLQEENSKLRLQLGQLERMFNEEKQNKSSQDIDKNKKNTALIQVLREQIQQLEEKVEKNEKKLNQQRQKNNQYKESINRLNETISNLKCQEDYAINTLSIENNAKSKLEILVSETQNQLSELKEEKSNLLNLREQDQKQIQRLNFRVKDLLNKTNTQENNIKKLDEQLTVLNNNYLQKVKELRESQKHKVTLERRVKQLQAEISSTTEKPALNMINSELQRQFNKKMAIFEKQLEIKRNQLKLMHQNEHKILLQKTKSEAELKKLHNILGESNKQLEIAQNQKESLMKQNKELKDILESTKSEGYNRSSEIYRHKETLDSYEIMIQDLRAGIKNEQNNNKIYAQKINQLEKKIEKQKSNNKQLFEDNKQLKLIVESLTKTKEEIFQKYKAVSEEKFASDNKKVDYIKQFNDLLSEKNKLEAQVQQKTTSILTLNTSYDELQNILDDKTQENENLKVKIMQMQKELHKCGKGLGQREMNIQGMSNKIKTLENKVQKMEKEYQRSCSELNDCHYELNGKNNEIQQLNNEMKLIIFNTKELQSANDRLKNLVEQSDRKIKQRTEQYDEQRELAASYKIQNVNLMEELRVQKQDIRKLENYMKEVAEQNNRMYNTLTQRDQQLTEMSEAYRVLELKEDQYIEEIKFYERQIRRLGGELEKNEEQIRRLIQDRDIYRAEASSSRRSNNSEVKYHFEERLQSLQNDYEIKKRECEKLRMDLREYEKIIEQERHRNYFLEQQRIEERNLSSSSQTPIKRFDKSRVESENWDGYNRDILEIQPSFELQNSKPEKPPNQSFRSNASIDSKIIDEKLERLQKQYEATITPHPMHKK